MIAPTEISKIGPIILRFRPTLNPTPQKNRSLNNLNNRCCTTSTSGVQGCNKSSQRGCSLTPDHNRSSFSLTIKKMNPKSVEAPKLQKNPAKSSNSSVLSYGEIGEIFHHLRSLKFRDIMYVYMPMKPISHPPDLYTNKTYVCIYIYMSYIYIYVRVFTYVYVYIHMCVCIHSQYLA